MSTLNANPDIPTLENVISQHTTALFQYAAIGLIRVEDIDLDRVIQLVLEFRSETGHSSAMSYEKVEALDDILADQYQQLIDRKG